MCVCKVGCKERGTCIRGVQWVGVCVQGGVCVAGVHVCARRGRSVCKRCVCKESVCAQGSVQGEECACARGCAQGGVKGGGCVCKGGFHKEGARVCKEDNVCKGGCVCSQEGVQRVMGKGERVGEKGVCAQAGVQGECETGCTQGECICAQGGV